MNRQEFCELMAQAKKRSGIGTTKLSLKLQMLPAKLRQFERGLHNFSMARVIEYLDAIGCHLVLSGANDNVRISDYDTLPAWIKQMRMSRGLTVRDMADKIGCSSSGLSHAEIMRTIIRFDLFISIVEFFNYRLIIQ